MVKFRDYKDESVLFLTEEEGKKLQKLLVEENKRWFCIEDHTFRTDEISSVVPMKAANERELKKILAR